MTWILLALALLTWWLSNRQELRGYVDGRIFTADQWMTVIGALGVLFWVLFILSALMSFL